MKKEDLSDFLSATKYCDKDHPEIQELAKRIGNGCGGDQVRSAIEIFNWVREEVKYAFDFWNVKASETLRKRFGMCANKANLQVALLRAIDIPAGYVILRIKKEAIRTIANDEIYSKSSDLIVHVYCCVFMNGEWISADASVDREIYEAAYANVPNWDYVQWNGNKHLLIPSEYIIDVSLPCASIDHFMDMPHRFLTREMLDRANEYIRQLRAKVRSLA